MHTTGVRVACIDSHACHATWSALSTVYERTSRPPGGAGRSPEEPETVDSTQRPTHRCHRKRLGEPKTADSAQDF